MERRKYIYMNRFVFMVHETLNGWVVWCIRTDSLDQCEATPQNLEMLDMAFPEGYQSHTLGADSEDAARLQLERLAVANNMTVLNGLDKEVRNETN